MVSLCTAWFFYAVEAPSIIKDIDVDYVLIAISSFGDAEDIRKYLEEDLSVLSDKIIWTEPVMM